ncbi:MAG: pyruvate, phosphate dikinase [Acidobacteria bacterium]|nr:pyruvate, phosphate dikinase [Acidobacteriota bacterium]
MTHPIGQTRELKCLTRIVETLREGGSFEEHLPRVLEILPEGFNYPEVLVARIFFDGQEFVTPGYRRGPYELHCPIVVDGQPRGEIRVVYLENRSTIGRENPFHLDQKKLVDLAARKLGRYAEVGPEVRPVEPAGDWKPEWKAMLDLLAEIDTSLHGRLLRRLMNHMTKGGVPGVHKMIARLDPALYEEEEPETHGSNVPLPKRDGAEIVKIYTEITRLASLALEEEALNALFKQWMRQAKLGYLAIATERRDVPLVEISQIVDRFCRETREDEPALSPADDTNVRVALIRRFLTDNLKFIGIAKEHLSIYDFGRLMGRLAGPAQGNGKMGGKAAGLILAASILEKVGAGNPLLRELRTPPAWYITSDGIYDFLRNNSLEDLWSWKFTSIEEIRDNFPYLEQVFKNSYFSLEMYHQLGVILDDLGEGPLIVRSSSLLEDSYGSAFSGKYRSLFLPNTGTRKQRLDALMDAVAEVYSSVHHPDPIQYRAERGLLDFMEEMGIIIMRVVGRKVGKYWFPAFAGVAFSHNELRWSPRIKREDGLLRVVVGLGTRAVDRVGNDFPVLISPGQPRLRVNTMPDQVMHYAQHAMDVINLESGQFESVPIDQLIREVGEEFPLLERLVSVHEEGMLRTPRKGMVDTLRDELVVTFAGLTEGTDFIKQMRAILDTLREAMGTPVDLEFAHDGDHLYLLQCRPQVQMGGLDQVHLPTRVPHDRKLFSASKYVTNGVVGGIRHIVYVDPEEYRQLPTRGDLLAVAEAVSRLNGLLERRTFILMGPGRWGSRGDLTLGVGVTYSGINNTAMLVEVARKKGNYVPDLSFGTHFFQDLVEAQIRYLALYPDEEENLFNEAFFRDSPGELAALLPDFARLDKVVRVIDVAKVVPGTTLEVVMDGERDKALGFLKEHR